MLRQQAQAMGLNLGWYKSDYNKPFKIITASKKITGVRRNV
jgi:hypothetical protein